MKKVENIGFPAPLLGEENLRLKVFHAEEAVVVLEKPVGVVSDAHPWYPEVPSVIHALREQAEKGKPELAALQIESLQSVFFLEKEISGAMLIATNEKTATSMRNLFGSRQIEFTFNFIAKARVADCKSMDCELPLAMDESQFKSFVSHRRGKKSATHFQLKEDLGAYQLWEAKAHYLRPHQIRLHAFESGFEMSGETLYGEVAPIFLSGLKKRYRPMGEEKPIYENLCLNLSKIAWDTGGVRIEVPIDMPRKFAVLLKQLRKYKGA